MDPTHRKVLVVRGHLAGSYGSPISCFEATIRFELGINNSRYHVDLHADNGYFLSRSAPLSLKTNISHDPFNDAREMALCDITSSNNIRIIKIDGNEWKS